MIEKEGNRTNLAVIVPCYNEELVIAESYRRTREVLEQLSVSTEIIYINDGSEDRTHAMLDEIAASDPHVKVIHFSRNFGPQAAVTAGINHCDADFAIILDADMQDPPELIPEILSLREREQANVVYCVRKSREGESFFKRLTAKAFYRMLNYMSEVSFPLDTGDFRLIDRKVMDQFNRFHERGKYIRGLISWVGFKQVPFYYEREARIAGESKYPFSKMLSFAVDGITSFSVRPLRYIVLLGLLFILISIVAIIYGFLSYLEGDTMPGWTSLLVSIWFIGGMVTTAIGIIGEYVGKIYKEVKRRPRYFVEKVSGIGKAGEGEPSEKQGR